MRRLLALVLACVLALGCEARADSLTSPPYTDAQARTASPVQSVTGQTGVVMMPTLCSPVTAGTAVSGTTAETVFGNTCTIPANTVKPGTSVVLHVGGIYSAAAANAAVGKVYYTQNASFAPGTDTAPISTGSLTGIAGQTSKNEWWGDIWITFYSTTQMDVQGLLIFQAATNVIVMIGNDTTFPIDATKDLKFYLTVQWSSNSTQNSMNLRTMNMK